MQYGADQKIQAGANSGNRSGPHNEPHSGVCRLKGLAKPCLHVASVSSAYFLSRIDRADVDFAAPLPSVEGPLAIENSGSVPFSPEERQALTVFRQEFLACQLSLT